MDQNSQNKNPLLGENVSLIRRCLYALTRSEGKPRRTLKCHTAGISESLEVRQVLSSTPLDRPTEISLPDDHPIVKLTESEQLFVDSAIQQIDQSMRQFWDQITTSMAGRPRFVDGNQPNGQELVTGVISNKSPRRSETSPDDLVSTLQLNADDAVQLSEDASVTVDFEAATEDTTLAVVEDRFSEQSVALVLDPVIPEESVPPVSEELAVTRPVNQTQPIPRIPRTQESLEVRVHFAWDDHQSGVDVQLPDESTLVITIRGEASKSLSAASRQLLENTISEAAVSLVQFFVPGTSVRVSLFTTSNTETSGGPRLEARSAIESPDASSDTMEASNIQLNNRTDREIPAIDPAGLSVLKSSSTDEPVHDLDVVFESIDSVLFPTLNDLPGGILRSEPGALSGGRVRTVVETETHLSDVSSGRVEDAAARFLRTLSSDPSLGLSLNLLAIAADAPVIVTQTTDSILSPGPKQLQKTPAAAVLRLLFDDDREYEAAGLLKSRITPDVGSLTVSTQAEQPAVRRQRVSQRDASGTFLLSFWQDEENTLPPVPSSDGVPREIQLAERSRGPPLVRSARDDLLTDYTAPANLLERLRYSISPRGPSLVTADVQ
ncbi:MAG: hypothetical protein ACK58L_18540 [Planctomycetota bacterium]